MSYGAEERWDRVGKTMFVVGGILVAAAIYGLVNGDDLRGVVMTIAPGALMFAIGWLAIRQRDRIAFGTPPTAIDWFVRVGSAIMIIAVVVVAVVRSSSGPPDATTTISPGSFELPSDVEIGEIPGPNGTPIKSLVRKYRREDCPDTFIPDPQPADPSQPKGRCPPPPIR
ncbi:MAG TPA: hypothetical protein VF403_01300 [Kofleriaceae bacterium]